MPVPYRGQEQTMIILEETPADIPAIEEVTIAAFKTLAISSNSEQGIVGFRAEKPSTPTYKIFK